MSRKRRKSLFDVFNDLMREVDEEFREFVEEFERFSTFQPSEVKREEMRPFVYGFRITVGPDGKPRIQEFGNVKRAGVVPKISEEIEPLVDVMDEGNKVRVIAEVPGVEKDEIKLKAVGRKLIISASNSKKYYKEVDLPYEVDMKTAKAKYKNGVLEVEISKLGSSGEFEIKIE